MIHAPITLNSTYLWGMIHHNNVEDFKPLYELDHATQCQAFYGDAIFSPPTLLGFKKYCRRHYGVALLHKDGVQLSKKEAHDLFSDAGLEALWNAPPQGRDISAEIDELIAENGGSKRDTINVLMARLDQARREVELTTEEKYGPRLYRALVGIMEIGKRDMSNPKYDSYFVEAGEAIAQVEGGENRFAYHNTAKSKS